MNLSEPVATLIAAFIGVAGGVLGTFVTSVVPERKKGRGLLADLLDTIASDVSDMVTMFEKEQIPHTAGHALDSKIEYFNKATHRAPLSPRARDAVDGLKQLAQEAETVDAYLYQGIGGETLRTAWITKAQRLVGELKGEAAKLRAGS
ncbi:MAG: hypothetical protein JWN43_2252 [Gammaproteobacteria bacterium]|nr:hypothetical protein [Gammaproteobacteria bacterium]